MDQTCNELWQKLSVALKPQVSPDTFKRWFSAVELVKATDDSLTFSVPNNIYQFWIESNHMTALQSAINIALGGPRQVKFCPPAGQSDMNATVDVVAEDQPEEPREIKPTGSALGLNPRNNFETFVVGPNNEIAHAASLAVAQSPARTYNPLFIYG